MKYSMSLLKRFISLTDSIENINNNLILKVCEIDEIIKRQIPDDVVIGYVEKVEKHPDADKLFVCQVDCGAKGKFQIATGGENVVADSYVPTAIPGCYLPYIDLKIEGRKMRGLESNGMICSKHELGIEEDNDQHRIRNLWTSSDDCMQTTFDDLSKDDIGKPLGEKYPWLNNMVLDLENKGITHRPDLTGHLGIANELFAIYSNQPEKISFHKVTEYYKTFKHTNIFELLQGSQKASRKVVAETNGVRSYILFELNNIEVKNSTFMTRVEMLDLGSQSRSNWVDFSNIFMLASGQPVHFFDADKVDGDIIVRNAKTGEKFVDLFEKEHTLIEKDIVIADKNKILALAGVVGGLESGITQSTKNIIVEIGNFDPVMVRKTGTRLSLRTDAELRFEKNINPGFTLFSFLLFLDLLGYYSKDLSSFEKGGISYYSSEETSSMISNPKEITVDFERLEKYIFGTKYDGFEVIAKGFLEGLGFEIKNGNTVIVPIRRGLGDMNIQEDIIEEVARIYGYDNIKNLPLVSAVYNVDYTPYVDIQRKIEDYFVRNGKFDQIETYPWVEDKLLEIFSKDKAELYSLQNSVNVDSPCLRDSLVYNLLSYAAKDAKFFDSFRIFDTGKTWDKKRNNINKSDFEHISEAHRYVGSFVGERMQLGGIVYQKSAGSWQHDCVLATKGLISDFLKELGLDGSIEYRKSELANYHPKKQAEMFYGDVLLGFVGTLHPNTLKNIKIEEFSDLAYFSIYLDSLIKLIEVNNKEKIFKYETLQDQIVYRDLCVVVDDSSDFSNIINAAKTVQEVQSLEVFDVYKGASLGENKKSIALKMKISGENMTSDDINNIMNKVIKACENAGGKLRV